MSQPTHALSSPTGALGPLLSSAHGQWGLFLLAQLENTHGPATLPCHVSRLFAHWGCKHFGGVALLPHCISVLPARGLPSVGRWWGCSAARASLSPASPCRFSLRAAPGLAVSSCCPQPASEEVTGSCLTLSWQIGSCEEAGGRRGDGDLHGSLPAVTCPAGSPLVGRAREGITAHSSPTSSQPGSGHQVSITSTRHLAPQNAGQGKEVLGGHHQEPHEQRPENPHPKKGLQPGPCSGVSQGQRGNSKTETVPEPVADLCKRLWCFVDYQSIWDCCSLIITGFPGACSDFFFPSLANRLITYWHLTEVQHLLCFPPCD